MKTAILFLCLVLCGCSLALPEAMVSIEVIDDTGARLGGCDIEVIFEINGKEITSSGTSHTNILFTAAAHTGHPYVTAVAMKKGYYKSSLTYMYNGQNDAKTKLEPWNPTLTLVLRKIKDPVLGKRIDRRQGKDKQFPVYDQEIGFDLLKGDWVAPYGEGQTTDFIFTISRNKKEKISYYTAIFPNKGDGIQEYFYTKPFWSSQFKWPHLAPLEGYKSDLKKKRIWGGDKARLPDFEEFQSYEASLEKPLNYIFRIRTQYDEKGNIKFAYYGRIEGDIINMRFNRREMLNYWINTDPTSRSLESIDLADQN